MKTLVIDIGNTSTSIGIYRKGKVCSICRCESRADPAEDVVTLLENRPAEKVVVASVVPSLNAHWEKWLNAAGFSKVLFVSHKLELGISVNYPNPGKIGADRLANATAAARLIGAPSVVCDFGTALTFDVLDADRSYIGGIICPGLSLMFDYLAEKTALLPHVKPVKTRAVIGRSTRQAMQIGARLGYRGMVREILNNLKKELKVRKLPVCCTGGYAEWIFKEWDVKVLIDPHLTLKGLGIIGELNG